MVRVRKSTLLADDSRASRKRLYKETDKPHTRAEWKDWIETLVSLSHHITRRLDEIEDLKTHQQIIKRQSDIDRTGGRADPATDNTVIHGVLEIGISCQSTCRFLKHLIK